MVREGFLEASKPKQALKDEQKLQWWNRDGRADFSSVEEKIVGQ